MKKIKENEETVKCLLSKIFYLKKYKNLKLEYKKLESKLSVRV